MNLAYWQSTCFTSQKNIFNCGSRKHDNRITFKCPVGGNELHSAAVVNNGDTRQINPDTVIF